MRSIKTFNTLAEYQEWIASVQLTDPIIALDNETGMIHFFGNGEGPIQPIPMPEDTAYFTIKYVTTEPNEKVNVFSSIVSYYQNILDDDGNIFVKSVTVDGNNTKIETITETKRIVIDSSTNYTNIHNKCISFNDFEDDTDFNISGDYINDVALILRLNDIGKAELPGSDILMYPSDILVDSNLLYIDEESNKVKINTTIFRDELMPQLIEISDGFVLCITTNMQESENEGSVLNIGTFSTYTFDCLPSEYTSTITTINGLCKSYIFPNIGEHTVNIEINNNLWGTTITELGIPIGIPIGFGCFSLSVHTSLSNVTYITSHNITNYPDSLFSGYYNPNQNITIEIPAEVEEINNSCFYACRLAKTNIINNTNIDIDNWNAEIYDEIVNHIAINDHVLVKYFGTGSEMIIPEGVTTIPNGAIDYGDTSGTGNKYYTDPTSRGASENVRKLTIPSTVTSIGYEALMCFYLCPGNIINNSSLNAETNKYWGAVLLDYDTDEGICVANDNGLEAVVQIRPSRNENELIIPEGIQQLGVSFGNRWGAKKWDNNDIVDASVKHLVLPSTLTKILYSSTGRSGRFHDNYVLTCKAPIAPKWSSKPTSISSSGCNCKLQIPEGSDYSSWISGTSSFNHFEVEYI